MLGGGHRVRVSLAAVVAVAAQARGTDAVAALRALDTAGLAERDAITRRCMLERLDERKRPGIALDDRFLSGVLAEYHEYWLRSLRAEHPQPDNEAWLLARLHARVEGEGEKQAASMEDLEPALEALIGARGHHALLGMTRPLRELMLWRTESETRYDDFWPSAGPPSTTSSTASRATSATTSPCRTATRTDAWCAT